MNLQPELVAGRLGLLLGPRAEQEAMFKVVALLAMRGSVYVLDGGNCFDAYRVARCIRRQTPAMTEALDRISIARAFTCYQVISLFEQTAATQTPYLVLDLLSTFCDESVSLEESQRLLNIGVDHLRRLRLYAPVVVSIRPPPQPERLGLIEILRGAADQVYMREAPGRDYSSYAFLVNSKQSTNIVAQAVSLLAQINNLCYVRE